jgi:peroxiredoxin
MDKRHPMKKIILMLMTVLPVLAFAQDGKYSIQGTLGTYNAPAKVYLQYRLNGKVLIDSTTLKDGKFQFSGTVSNWPLIGHMRFNKKGTGMNGNDYKQVFLEPGTITLTGDSTIAGAKASGTKANDDNIRYIEAYKPIDDAYNALEARKNAATSEQRQSDAFKKDYNKAEKDIEAQDAATNKKFISENPDSYISLIALESYIYGADYADIEPLYNALTPEVKQSDEGKKFALLMPKLKAVALGATAPEFAEADTSGKMVSLSSFRGKYVLIDFWASWCGPCRGENPNVVKAFNHYKSQKFTIIGVSLDRANGKKNWLDAIHKDGLAWTQVSDLKFWDSKAAALYGVRGIPQNFLLDPEGKIIAKNLRGDDLENKLEEIFRKI